MLDKPACALAQIQVAVPDCISDNHVCDPLAVKQKMPTSRSLTVLDEAVKIINFNKSWPLNTHLFNILCDEMGSSMKHLCISRYSGYLRKNTGMIELQAKLTSFFMKHFYVKEWLTEKLRFGYLADIFLEMNDMMLVI